MKEKARQLYIRLRKFTPPVFFFSGFILDIITLGRIDEVFNLISQIFYLILITVILFLDFMEYDFSKFQNRFIKKVVPYINEILHFFLGALLSAYTIFYFKSSSMATSLIFMFFMALLLILNEVPIFQRLGMSIKFAIQKLCLSSFFVCSIPIVLGITGPWVFVFSLFISLLVSTVLAYWLKMRKLSFEKVFKCFYIPHVSVLSFFILVYFFKIIPPVPLALKSIGIFHNVERHEREYKLSYIDPGMKFWIVDDQEFFAQKGDKVFVFVKVFSPTDFSEKIFLNWQKRNQKGQWMTSDKIPLNISGGRNDGYRGFSYKRNYTPGKWRVLVETKFGLELGRIPLEIKLSKSKTERKIKVRFE